MFEVLWFYWFPIEDFFKITATNRTLVMTCVSDYLALRESVSSVTAKMRKGVAIDASLAFKWALDGAKGLPADITLVDVLTSAPEFFKLYRAIALLTTSTKLALKDSPKYLGEWSQAENILQTETLPSIGGGMATHLRKILEFSQQQRQKTETLLLKEVNAEVAAKGTIVQASLKHDVWAAIEHATAGNDNHKEWEHPLTTALGHEQVGLILRGLQEFDSTKEITDAILSAFSYSIAATNDFEADVSKARKAMAVANLAQRLHMTPGKNQSRTSLLSTALASAEAISAGVPASLEKAVYKILGITLKKSA